MFKGPGSPQTALTGETLWYKRRNSIVPRVHTPYYYYELQVND
jgi:hypothetical protein